jgi:hypothetical protein
VVQGGVVLPGLVQQVGQVGVERGYPVLVAQFAAEPERLPGQVESLTRAAGVGEQPGQVVERRHGRARVR